MCGCGRLFLFNDLQRDFARCAKAPHLTKTSIITLFQYDMTMF
ncbi:hypothetical protein N183_19465 [Sinorhizobium sp. Sb3]|nr:hypothetical protein N183_19465 [Sinorhizobium sp. Sb3]